MNASRLVELAYGSMISIMIFSCSSIGVYYDQDHKDLGDQGCA